MTIRFCFTFIILVAAGVLHAADPVDRGPVTVSEKAHQIHSRSFVFDGHNDLPWEVRTNGSRSFDKLDIAQPQPKMHTDIARLRAGNVGAQFWSVYVPADTAYNQTAHQTTIEQNRDCAGDDHALPRDLRHRENSQGYRSSPRRWQDRFTDRCGRWTFD